MILILLVSAREISVAERQLTSQLVPSTVQHSGSVGAPFTEDRTLQVHARSNDARLVWFAQTRASAVTFPDRHHCTVEEEPEAIG